MEATALLTLVLTIGGTVATAIFKMAALKDELSRKIDGVCGEMDKRLDALEKQIASTGTDDAIELERMKGAIQRQDAWLNAQQKELQNLRAVNKEQNQATRSLVEVQAQQLGGRLEKIAERLDSVELFLAKQMSFQIRRSGMRE